MQGKRNTLNHEPKCSTAPVFDSQFQISTLRVNIVEAFHLPVSVCDHINVNIDDRNYF